MVRDANFHAERFSNITPKTIYLVMNEPHFTTDHPNGSKEACMEIQISKILFDPLLNAINQAFEKVSFQKIY